MIDRQTIYQYIQNGKIEEALQALFGNIEEDPTIIENYINAGIVLADANEIEKAERFSKSFNNRSRRMASYFII